MKNLIAFLLAFLVFTLLGIILTCEAADRSGPYWRRPYWQHYSYKQKTKLPKRYQGAYPSDEGQPGVRKQNCMDLNNDGWVSRDELIKMNKYPGRCPAKY